MRSESGPGWEMRLGRWQDVMTDVTERAPVDAIICDPPYGGRTHENSRRLGNGRADGHAIHDLGPAYSAWTPDDVHDFVREWSPFCSGWMVALTSHDLIPAWQDAHDDTGRYCFAPLPCVMRGMSVRLCGDGPSSWTVFLMVARPKTKDFAGWGTLDGAYVGSPSREAGGGRGKPGWLMQALVRDYSRPGDLIADPFAGWGSTLAAAVALGRRAVGAEMDKAAFTEAVRRLRRPQQMDLLEAQPLTAA